jgi:hypothetical protein
MYAILKRLVKNPCRAPVACVLLNLQKRVVKYQALINFSFSKPYFGQMSTDPKIPFMQSEKCGVSREAARA